MEKPSISVIIPSYNSRMTIEQCLRALETQIDHSGIENEVILVDSSSDGTAELVADQFPWVKLFHFSERIWDGNARNFGITQARSDLLAFVDADCVVDSGWLAEMVTAHRTEHPVIGGVIAHANPESYVGWANYFCEFAQWLPQNQTRFMADIPSACYSVKRWAFEKYGPFLEDTSCSDTAFNWLLQSKGYRPLFVPTIQVSHISVYTLKGLLLKKLRHGRAFAQMRVVEKTMPLWKRLVYWSGLWALPFVLFYRRAHLVTQHPPYIVPFIKSAPLVWLALAAWSLGEGQGYWAGAYTTSVAAINLAQLIPAYPLESNKLNSD
jgi:glycosyltransferase involved in cell wall biosynthesis